MDLPFILEGEVQHSDSLNPTFLAQKPFRQQGTGSHPILDGLIFSWTHIRKTLADNFICILGARLLGLLQQNNHCTPKAPSLIPMPLTCFAPCTQLKHAQRFSAAMLNLWIVPAQKDCSLRMKFISSSKTQLMLMGYVTTGLDPQQLKEGWLKQKLLKKNEQCESCPGKSAVGDPQMHVTSVDL